MREWRNEEFDFGIHPPAGAEGPFSVPENVTALFFAQWIDAAGRRYFIQILSGTIENFVLFNRDLIMAAGGAFIQDRAWGSTSGRAGWILEAQLPGGHSVDVVLERNGIVFNAGVADLTGASSADLQVVTNFIDSLCADP